MAGGAHGAVARGVGGVAGAAVLSLGGAHDLRLHVAGHLLLGMVAPLLLVTAAPVTLALRALPRERARTLGRLLRSRPLAVLTHPAVAALLDVGGLWLLYRTDAARRRCPRWSCTSTCCWPGTCSPSR